MNHLVPDFGMEEDDYSIHGTSRVKKPSMPEDEIMELLWQNGQVVIQSQNQQRSQKKSPPPKILIEEDASIPAEQSVSRAIRSSSVTAPPPDDVSSTHLFMQEDEMASWLHYPLDDTSFARDFCSDFLYPTSNVPATTTIPHTPDAVRTTFAAEHRTSPPMETVVKPPIPPVPSSRRSNFVHFSRKKEQVESRPFDSNKGVRESTVVDSNETPTLGKDSRVSSLVRRTNEIGNIAVCGSVTGAAVASTSYNGGVNKEPATCDMTVTSSPGGSGASGSACGEPVQKPPAEDRKRKSRQADCYSEDVEFEPASGKKQVQGLTSAKRSRAAEVHNLSERKRRDRINEKMKALQELIPRCNKSDKASMLDEAIEYLKSLQMQVQMMSMGCSMVPMMFPGVQQFMPPMGMGMGMGMDMSRPMMMPFPSGMPPQSPITAAHMGPRYPMPAYHMQPVPAPPDPSQTQPNPHPNPAITQFDPRYLNNRPRVPNMSDPYQRYMSFHQMQMPLPQNQAIAQSGTGNPSPTAGTENLERRQSG